MAAYNKIGLQNTERAIELLAPAKDLACGLTAIAHGADAVYIGAGQFSARMAARNCLADIATLTQEAHKYWVRVYVTLNTLLYDEELPAALRLIEQLSVIGVDGLIIQDVGLLECDLPPIPLIASTQMHNACPAKVKFLEDTGFDRAILARELSLDEICAIRAQATKIELECFVHGALCVSYSGRCYLSYAQGGRSGNRGQCAQPCRKRYTLQDTKGNSWGDAKHFLSLRDLNLAAHVRELLVAGISSFKIEGRLKDAAYVANVVSYYRQKLDEILPQLGLMRSSGGISRADFIADVQKTFNRGFTNFFINGRSEKVARIETPKMIGEVIGEVKRCNQYNIEVQALQSLKPGDGLCFFDTNGELCGTAINAVTNSVVTPNDMTGLCQGQMLYRNLDSKFLAALRRGRCSRRIPLSCMVIQYNNQIIFSVTDENGCQAKIAVDNSFSLAEKPDQALATLKRQLGKMGDTEFVCTDVEVQLTEMPFMSVGLLNSLRRELVCLCQQQREQLRIQNLKPVLPRQCNIIPYGATHLTYEENVLNKKAEIFYHQRGVNSIEPAAENGLDLRDRKVMSCRYCLKEQLDLCPHKSNYQAPSSEMVEPLMLVDDKGHKLELRFDCHRCLMEIYFRQ